MTHRTKHTHSRHTSLTCYGSERIRHARTNNLHPPHPPYSAFLCGLYPQIIYTQDKQEMLQVVPYFRAASLPKSSVSSVLRCETQILCMTSLGKLSESDFSILAVALFLTALLTACGCGELCIRRRHSISSIVDDLSYQVARRNC